MKFSYASAKERGAALFPLEDTEGRPLYLRNRSGRCITPFLVALVARNRRPREGRRSKEKKQEETVLDGVGRAAERRGRATIEGNLGRILPRPGGNVPEVQVWGL
jgi:hypothetical protein